MTKPDPLSASALLVPEVTDALLAFAATHRMVLREAENLSLGEANAKMLEAERLLVAAIRDATLSAHRSALLALTEEQVVEEAVKVAVRKAQEIAANTPYGGIEPFYAELVPAIVPLLLAPEVAKREAAEKANLESIREYQKALQAHHKDEQKLHEELRTATDQLDFIEGCLKDAGFLYEDDPNHPLLKREVDDRAERAIKAFVAAEAEATRLRGALTDLLRTADEPQGAAEDARAIIAARAALEAK